MPNPFHQACVCVLAQCVHLKPITSVLPCWVAAICNSILVTSSVTPLSFRRSRLLLSSSPGDALSTTTLGKFIWVHAASVVGWKLMWLMFHSPCYSNELKLLTWYTLHTGWCSLFPHRHGIHPPLLQGRPQEETYWEAGTDKSRGGLPL